MRGSSVTLTHMVYGFAGCALLAWSLYQLQSDAFDSYSVCPREYSTSLVQCTGPCRVRSNTDLHAVQVASAWIFYLLGGMFVTEKYPARSPWYWIAVLSTCGAAVVLFRTNVQATIVAGIVLPVMAMVLE